MNKTAYILVVLTILLYAIPSPGQRMEPYTSIGIQLNAINYFGDMNPLEQYVSTELSFTRPNISVDFTKKIAPRIHLRASLGYGRLRGDDFEAADPNRQQAVGRYGRNLHFRNDIFELAVVGMVDLFPNDKRFYRRRPINPYIFGGIALFYHNPKAKTPRGANGEEGEWVALRPLRTEGQGLPGYGKQYSLIQPAIPVGLGVKWKLNDKMDISAEIGFRFLFTDYIDDVSTVYPDLRDLPNDLSRIMSDRSAEPLAAISGDNRNLSNIIPIVGDFSNVYGVRGDGNLTPLFDANGNQLTRLGGYGLRGDKRGNSPKEKSSFSDMYVVTGFHFNYLFASVRFPRYVDKNTSYYNYKKPTNKKKKRK